MTIRINQIRDALHRTVDEKRGSHVQLVIYSESTADTRKDDWSLDVAIGKPLRGFRLVKRDDDLQAIAKDMIAEARATLKAREP